MGGTATTTPNTNPWVELKKKGEKKGKRTSKNLTFGGEKRDGDTGNRHRTTKNKFERRQGNKLRAKKRT